jgi:DNA-binding NtrC family response regulator
MSYLFKQKLDLGDLISLNYSPPKVVLVAEPEEYLLNIYCNCLRSYNLQVEECRRIEDIFKSIKQYSPHLLLLSLAFPPNFYRLFFILENLRKNHPNLRILTIGDKVNTEVIKRLMSVGVSSHIEKQLTRPQDIILIARSILEY